MKTNLRNDQCLNDLRLRNSLTVNSIPYVMSFFRADKKEIDWMSLHPDPVAISIQLPDMPDRPEWKLNGSIITVPDLPVNSLISTVRERIKRVVDADLPISRLKLNYGEKTLNNAQTMASINLDDGDMLVMSVRKK